jgi:DNA end-binding protein Ku
LPERSGQRLVPRAFWSGTITFGLVSIPVDLFAAVHARETAMKMVDEKGRALGRRYYSENDKELAEEQIVRGYETDSGEMVVLTDAELDAAAPEMSRDIELKRFVPLEDIPPAYFQRPYFLVPSGRSTKAYHLLAETMQRAGRVGIGSFVMRGHEYLVAIISDGGVLRAETLRFADELRSPEGIGLPKIAKAPAKRVNAFVKTIEGLTQDRLDLGELSDRYAQAMRKLAQAKEKRGEDVVSVSGLEDEDETSGAEVVDLVKILRERLAAATPSTRTAAARAPPPSATKAKAREEQSLEELSREELYERAKALDIPARSKMSKAALVAALRAHGKSS